MAEKLEGWPKDIKIGRGGNRRSRDVQYTWDLWFDGNVWKIVQGKDFTCKILSMQALIYINAKNRNLTVTTAILPDENAIVLQVISPPQEVLTLPYDSHIVRKLKEEIKKNNVVDIGKGAEQQFNVSEATFTKAVEALKNQGYDVYKVKSAHKKTGNMVELTVLGKARSAHPNAKRALDNK